MAVDITALYCCLDDFCKVFEDWEAHRLIPSQTTRQRRYKRMHYFAHNELSRLCMDTLTPTMDKR